MWNYECIGICKNWLNARCDWMKEISYPYTWRSTAPCIHLHRTAKIAHGSRHPTLNLLPPMFPTNLLSSATPWKTQEKPSEVMESGFIVQTSPQSTLHSNQRIMKTYGLQFKWQEEVQVRSPISKLISPKCQTSLKIVSSQWLHGHKQRQNQGNWRWNLVGEQQLGTSTQQSEFQQFLKCLNSSRVKHDERRRRWAHGIKRATRVPRQDGHPRKHDNQVVPCGKTRWKMSGGDWKKEQCPPWECG